MPETPDNETHRRILQTAEELFARRGYAAVRLREIAEAVNMKHASLYYYVPGGKEELFRQVFAYSFRRHRDGLERAIEDAGPFLYEQLYAVAAWFISEPAMDLARLRQGDRPDLDAAELARLSQMAYDALREPIAAALARAAGDGEVEIEDVDLAAMALISLVQSARAIPGTSAGQRRAIGQRLVDMILDGWRPR